MAQPHEELAAAYAALEVADKRAAELQSELEQAAASHPEDRVQELAQQLAASQAEAEAAREAAEAGQAMASEMQRLAEDNALLASRTRQMEIDLQELLGTSGLGHNNPKQKIQYHLRLKQELEEMRRECMALLRERFHLEQAVR
eukprot:jgi/Astpho2/8723/Aster-x0365